MQRALRRCLLITDHNRRLGMYDLPIRANAGLLYPRENAPSLTELPAVERPGQLVIIDGTWHQAKTIVRDVPQLWNLPCYQLTPSLPGTYRIRREPNAHSLSTLEATVAALRALESDTVGLDQLLAAFHAMVENQLTYPDNQAVRRRRQKRESRRRYLPHSLMQSPTNLVVAYGEATPGQSGQRPSGPTPVSWVAQRLGAADRFSCRLRQPKPLSDGALEHMRLSPTDFDAAVSEREFRQRWKHFLHPSDVLIVYHQRTFHLLRHVEAIQPRCLVLKAIFRKWRPGFRSLEELVVVEGVTLPDSDHMSRADERLDMAVALVEHLLCR